MPWRQPRLALAVLLGTRRRRRVKWCPQTDSPRQGPDWHPAGRLAAARWEGTKGRDARIRPPLPRPRPRLGQRLVKGRGVGSSGCHSLKEVWGRLHTEDRPLYPVTRAHSLWRSRVNVTPFPRPCARLFH